MPKANQKNLQRDLRREARLAQIKGHCRDNLEWIISCLNNGNRDKQKKEDFKTDPPTTWNTKRFYEYIGLD